MCKCDFFIRRMIMRISARSALSALLLSALTLSFGGCGNDNATPYAEYHYTGMGENITILLAETASSEAAARDCAREITANGNALSDKDPTSDVCAINGEINLFMTEDETLLQVLSISQTITEITGGAYDCTYGALTDCWANGALPGENAIAEALSHSGRDKFTVAGKTITKNDPAAKLDFSRLAPGMAVQKALESLSRTDIPYGIVSVGENCGVFGTKPDGGTFKIGLRDPRDTDAVFGYLTISSGFISTIGDYNNVSDDGVKINCILDLTTGQPAETSLDSVTVYAANGAAANALSYALYVMGLEDALALYESDPAILFEAVFVTDDGEVVVTPGAADIFELHGEKYMMKSAD